MFEQAAKVYIPVKTPDYPAWAWLLSVVAHGLLLGALIFFYHTPAPKPMQTTLVTPEELAAIQGELAARQQAQTSQQTAHEPLYDERQMNGFGKTRPAHSSQALQDTQARQAAWEREQAEFARKLDAESQAEQQQFIDQLNDQQDQQQAQLEQNRQAEKDPNALAAELNSKPNATNEGKIKITSVDMPAKTAQAAAATSNTASQNANNASLTSHSSNDKAAAAGYLNQISAIIYSHWSVPNNAAGKSLKASFTIAGNGTISNITINGAGDEAFKNSLLAAIQAASPLPTPPDDDDVRRVTVNFVAK